MGEGQAKSEMDTPVAQWMRARRREAGGGDEGAGSYERNKEVDGLNRIDLDGMMSYCTAFMAIVPKYTASTPECPKN